MNVKPKTFLCLALALSGGWLAYSAAGQYTMTSSVKRDDYVVSIVPQRQSNSGFADMKAGSPLGEMKAGVPVVVVSPVSQRSDALIMDEPSDNCFFVVIRNTKPVAVTNTMDASSWYDCLQFKMTDASGKVYSITRGGTAWYANGPASWVFPGNGMRVIAVDFTRGARAEWQGLPQAPAQPEIVSMTATFRYFDPSRKPVSISSEATEVYLLPRKFQ